MHEDCVFCKIVRGEIPSFKVYEDKDFLAFLDIEPLNQGHTIIIPKNHVRWINDLDSSTEIWHVAQRIAKALVKGLKYNHVNFITLGYEVKHGHIHVIPRNPGDDLGQHIDWSKRKEIKNAEETAAKIKENI